MPKQKYYAVYSGANTGVFDTWAECSANVTGVKGAKFCSFPTREEAEKFVQEGKVQKPELKSEKDTLYFYTDGSCVGNDGTTPAGWGYCCVMNENLLFESCGRVILEENEQNFLGAEVSTNNTGELSAIGHAFRVILQLDFKPEIVIRADSVYAINCLEGNYKVNKNEKLIKTIVDLKKRIEFNGKKIKLEHVKAHIGHEFNERADKLANKGRLTV